MFFFPFLFTDIPEQILNTVVKKQFYLVKPPNMTAFRETSICSVESRKTMEAYYETDMTHDLADGYTCLHMETPHTYTNTPAITSTRLHTHACLVFVYY